MSEGKQIAEMLIPKITGYTITGAVTDQEGEYWGFQVEKKGHKKIVWVLCDPEGNGSGFLDITEG